MSWRVKCANNETKKCAWMGDPDDLPDHLDVCPFEEVACFNEDCSVVLERRLMEEHLMTPEACQWHPIECQHCGQFFSKSRQQEHEDICEDFPVSCLCKATLPRHQMPAHRHPEYGECPEIQVECTFAMVGCNFEGKRKDFERHNKKNCERHLSMLLKEFVRVKESLRRAEDNLAKMHRELKDSASSLRHKREEYCVKNYEQEYNERHYVLEQQDREKKRHSKGKMPRAQVDEAKVGTMSETSSLDDSGLGDITVPLKDDPIPRLDMGQGIVPCSCNRDGTLLWKIPGIRKLLNPPLTEEGRTPIFSTPFYTGKYGYKVRLELYPNGFGAGKDTHMSLYFMIMSGEYDDLLPWPFQQRVVFVLYDQNTAYSLRHHHEVVIIDQEKLTVLEMTCPCLMRPEGSANEGYGVDRFVSHKNLNAKTFVKNDTVYIKALIDVL